MLMFYFVLGFASLLKLWQLWQFCEQWKFFFILKKHINDVKLNAAEAASRKWAPDGDKRMDVVGNDYADRLQDLNDT